MKLQKVSVLMADGKFYPVWAVSDGVLAIHKRCYIDFTDKLHQSLDRWSVTHIKSGMCATTNAGDIPRHKVCKVYEKARALVWRGLDVMAMPVCELLDLVPKIASDLGMAHSYDDTREWREIKAIAIDALHCDEAPQ